jgi:hypothetical protein
MNRTLHIRPNATMGLAAQARGLSCAADVAGFVQTASAQAGVDATQ